MSADDLVKWAKTLGYPGADSCDFRANLRKLTTPQLKHMWRHLMKYVKPANEVAHIRKQLLVYKLSIEGKHAQEVFEKVTDYEAFLKKNALEVKIGHLNSLIEKKKENIVNISTRLEETGERHHLQQLDEKEKLEKIRLLRLKRDDLEKQMKEFKELTPLFQTYMQPTYQNESHPATGAWATEVKKYCESLERGQEVTQMCERLKPAMKTGNIWERNESKTSGNAESMFLSVVEELHSDIGLRTLELGEVYDTKLKELETKKNDMISSLTSSGDAYLIAKSAVLKKHFESGFLQFTRTAAERKFLQEWINNNRSSSVGSPLNASYFEEIQKVAEADDMISDKRDTLLFYSSFPADKLRSSLDRIISLMKAEAASACSQEGTIDTVVHKLLSDLPQLVDLFVKTPLIERKNNSSIAGGQSVRDYVDLKSKYLKSKTINSFVQLDVSLRDRIADPSTLISSAESSIARDRNKKSNMHSNLLKLLQEIDTNSKNISTLLDHWEKWNLSDLVPNDPDYHNLLSRTRARLDEFSPDDQLVVLRKVWNTYSK